MNPLAAPGSSGTANTASATGFRLAALKGDVGAVLGLGYLLLASYALARPATESMFLETFGSEKLPWVWVVVAICAGLAIAAYHRYASEYDLATMFLRTLALSAATFLVLQIASVEGSRSARFLLYVWKDIYVVLLLELLWSFANVVFTLHTARWLYGLFCVCGSLGGISGNLATARIAGTLGTEATLWFVLPLFLAAAAIGLYLRRTLRFKLGKDSADPAQMPTHFSETLHMIRRSSYVAWMVILIALVQTVVTMIDYQFNFGLERAYPNMDERTAIVGNMYAIIDLSSVALQFLTFPLLRFVGVPITLLAIPLLLGGAVSTFLARPFFPVLAFAKTASKALDYSLFRAAKEILYIPLSYGEKTLGKALVDVFTYRVAKAAASIVLIGITALQPGNGVMTFTLLLIVAWLIVTMTIVRRFRRMVSREHEMRVHHAPR